MEIQLAVLADSANVAAGHKLNILGIFDTVQAHGFPMAHPFMVLALRLRIEFDDGGKTHQLVISLRDPDMKEYARATAEMKVPGLPAGKFQTINQILNFAGVTFVRPAEFAFHVSWNGQEKAQVPLNVIQVIGPPRA